MRSTSPQICSDCGNTFYARSDACYCSPACRQRSYRNRNTSRNEKPVTDVAGASQPRPVDELVVELAKIVAEFERHNMTITNPGVNSPKQHTYPTTLPDKEKLLVLPFADGAYEAIRDLVQRLKVIGDCLAMGEETRCFMAAMTEVAHGNENGPGLAKLNKLRRKLQ